MFGFVLLLNNNGYVFKLFRSQNGTTITKIIQYNVEDIAGAAGFEHILAKAGHYGLYGFMTVMPATGIAMGYYGGMWCCIAKVRTSITQRNAAQEHGERSSI